MDLGGRAPDRVASQAVVEHWGQVRTVHCLELLLIRIARGEVGKETELTLIVHLV